jgi:hypothetical protein
MWFAKPPIMVRDYKSRTVSEWQYRMRMSRKMRMKRKVKRPQGFRVPGQTDAARAGFLGGI